MSHNKIRLGNFYSSSKNFGEEHIHECSSESGSSQNKHSTNTNSDSSEKISFQEENIKFAMAVKKSETKKLPSHRTETIQAFRLKVIK